MAINIKPENRGKFTAYKKATGKSTSESLKSKSPGVRKMANFARMAKRHWKPLAKGGMIPTGAPQPGTAANSMAERSVPMTGIPKQSRPAIGMSQKMLRQMRGKRNFQGGGKVDKDAPATPAQPLSGTLPGTPDILHSAAKSGLSASVAGFPQPEGDGKSTKTRGWLKTLLGVGELAASAIIPGAAPILAPTGLTTIAAGVGDVAGGAKEADAEKVASEAKLEQLNKQKGQVQKAARGGKVKGMVDDTVGFNNKNLKINLKGKSHRDNSLMSKNEAGMDKGGKIKGPGGPKEDKIKMKADVGGFIVPTENAHAADLIREKYLGEKTQKVNLDAGGNIPETNIKVSDGERYFTKDEVDLLTNKHGLDLNYLAPDAEKSNDRAHGGFVKDLVKKVGHGNPITTIVDAGNDRNTRNTVKGRNVVVPRTPMSNKVNEAITNKVKLRNNPHPVGGFKDGGFLRTAKEFRQQKSIEDKMYQDGGNIRLKPIDPSLDQTVDPDLNPLIKYLGQKIKPIAIPDNQPEDLTAELSKGVKYDPPSGESYAKSPTPVVKPPAKTKMGIGEIAGIAQAGFGLASALAGGSRPRLTEPAQYRSIEKDLGERAAYGLPPEQLAMIRKGIEEQRVAATKTAAEMSYGSPGTALANISAISERADQAHLELNIKDYEAMMAKKAAYEGIKSERAKFDITRQGAELEAYLERQKASAQMLAGGIGNIVGAASYREWLRNMAENRKLTENIYNT